MDNPEKCVIRKLVLKADIKLLVNIRGIYEDNEKDII